MKLKLSVIFWKFISRPRTSIILLHVSYISYLNNKFILVCIPLLSEYASPWWILEYKNLKNQHLCSQSPFSTFSVCHIFYDNLDVFTFVVFEFLLAFYFHQLNHIIFCKSFFFILIREKWDSSSRLLYIVHFLWSLGVTCISR